MSSSLSDSPENRLSRRSLLAGTAVAATAAIAGSVGLSAPAVAADPPPIDGSTLPTLGPASVTAAVVTMAVHDGHAYLVTRGLVPAPIIDLDLATRKVVRRVDLPTGDGAWASTVCDGKIYVGMYAVPDVHCFDPATGSVSTIGRLGGNSGFVFNLSTAPDGQIFAATYPDGGVWQIDPSTGAFRKLGSPVPGAQYNRYVIADNNTVYSGIYTPAQLMAFNRATATFSDLTPESLRGAAFGPFALGGGRVYFACRFGLGSMAPDGSDLRITPLVPEESGLDAIAVAADGTAYVTARRSGSVYACAPDGSPMRRLDAPSPDDETRNIFLLDSDRTLLGCAGSGAVWWMDTATGEFELVDLIDAGVVPGPEKPQSIALCGSSVYVGGHMAIEQHSLKGKGHHRIRVGGEAKTLTEVDGQLYSAIYPSTEVVRLDPDTRIVHSLGRILHGQQRPWQSAFDPDTGLLAIASAPGTGALNGALTLLDVATGEMEVFPGILPDQSVMSVSIADGIAYLGGDATGGGGITPTRTAASIGALDLRQRRLLWTAEPLAGQLSIQSLGVLNGLAYVVMKRTSGSWIAYDLATRSVRYQGKLASYGQVITYRGQVYCETFGGGNLYHLGPNRSQARLLVNKLGDEWYTIPQFAPAPGFPRSAWGLSGRNLARIPLSV